MAISERHLSNRCPVDIELIWWFLVIRHLHMFVICHHNDVELSPITKIIILIVPSRSSLNYVSSSYYNYVLCPLQLYWVHRVAQLQFNVQYKNIPLQCPLPYIVVLVHLVAQLQFNVWCKTSPLCPVPFVVVLVHRGVRPVPSGRPGAGLRGRAAVGLWWVEPRPVRRARAARVWPAQDVHTEVRRPGLPAHLLRGRELRRHEGKSQVCQVVKKFLLSFPNCYGLCMTLAKLLLVVSAFKVL